MTLVPTLKLSLEMTNVLTRIELNGLKINLDTLYKIEKEYNEDGRLESLTTWKDGVKHGPYREREVYYDDYTGETDLRLERGMYVNGEKKGKFIRYFQFLPFNPTRDDWERGIHE